MERFYKVQCKACGKSGVHQAQSEIKGCPECGSAQIAAIPVQKKEPSQPETVGAIPADGGDVRSQNHQPKASPGAIWSLVLGILSVVLCLNVLAAIPGLILGILSLRKIGTSQQMLTGKGMAIAGIVLSSLGIMMVPVLISLAYPAYAKMAENAQIAYDVSNARQIVLACRAYAADNDGVYPGFSSEGEMLQTSTEVFNVLLDEGYLDTESLFWTPGNPNKPSPPIEDGTLTKEENCYTYVSGQHESTFSRSPLVADEMESPGFYGENHPWLRSRKVVVGYCGGQVMTEKLDSSQAGATVVTRDSMTVFQERKEDDEGRNMGGLLAVPPDQILLP